MPKKYELESLLLQRDHSERVITILNKRIKHIEKIKQDEEQKIDQILYGDDSEDA